MTKKNRLHTGSIQDALVKGEPITRFFYEYDGERSVDLPTLIQNGIDLWREQVDANQVHDNRHLWQFAKSLLQAPEATPMYSWAEWLRYQVMLGGIVPPRWKQSKAYPYKGVLISAIYFQEASRLCYEDKSERAWHIVVIAYYHLGMSTTASVLENSSKSAVMMHAERSEKVRALVLAALNLIKQDGSASSIEGAKDKVIEIFREKNAAIKDWLDEFDTLVPEKTKGRSNAKHKNDVFDRIRNLLDTWSLPSGPYPEVAASFSHFNKRKRKVTDIVTNEAQAPENVPKDKPRYYLRFINIRGDGFVSISKVSRREDD
jgi:hypothetical protein